ncbi:putative protein EXORDIUM [Helianthus annuus]|uniref:Uncharacterized protein n=1 Tax=Helianthus annuus TaxID=4232 RepID=A0A9K3JMZ6_HELAN|nr:putative protein EXORDIUM [Helianthus annuus]KAJ0604824.1 putative protein EXORDIUM [Helianthus annuus]KAJ0615441.1 putative protein EXORDIUM [Helianthus annuus]KAJ0618840.1 putative protein EXORDIUM [Helianthus annuus]KAJ0777297.1 putative protein EXORDIUM [Helianthus annuus]
MFFASSLLLISTIFNTCAAAIPHKLAPLQTPATILKYHNGSILIGNVNVNILWYGHFTPTKKTIITDFINSLNTRLPLAPSTASWWQTTKNYKGGPRRIQLGKQIVDEKYSLGKTLKDSHLIYLASKNIGFNEISLLLTG